MKKNKKYLLSAAVLVIIAGFTLYALLKDVKPSDIIHTMLKMNPIFIVLSILMVTLYVIFEGLGIKTSLRSFGTKITVRKSFAYASNDLYFSLITPSSTGGQPVMAYYMNRDSIPFSESTIAILITTICFKAVLMLLGLAVLIFFPGVVFKNGVLVTMLFFVGIAVNILLIFVCLLSMFSQNVVRKIVYIFVKPLSKLGIIKKPEAAFALLEKYLGDYAKCSHHIRTHKKVFIEVMLYNILQRAALFSISWFVYKGLGYGSLGYFEIICIQASIAICVNSLPIPGAAGVTEAVFAVLYSSIYPDNEVLVSAILITRIFEYYFGLILSGITTLTNHLHVKAMDGKRRTTV